MIGEKPKGGRGYRAVYSTKQMRVPAALEGQIQELIARYRYWIEISGADKEQSESPPRLLDKPVDELAAQPADNLAKPVDELAAQPVDNLAKPVDELAAQPVDSLGEQPEVKQMA